MNRLLKITVGLAGVIVLGLREGLLGADVTDQPGYVPPPYQGYAYPARSYLDTYSMFQLNETRAQFGIGPSFLLSSGNPQDSAAFSLRYRISPVAWPVSEENAWHVGPLPLSLYAEVGGIPPLGTPPIVSQQNRQLDSGTAYSADIRFENQVYLALIDELPHGDQTWIIPEIGAGISRTTTKIEYQSVFASTYSNPQLSNEPVPYFYSGTADTMRVAWSPYFSAGLHFFSDHFISLLVQGSYIAFPYSNSVQYQYYGAANLGQPPPPGPQPLHFPSSGWALQARLQMKLVWPTLVHTPLIPQMMPPWLLPAYTTEEISPWVASPEVAQKWTQPGHPSVGNVMFQYKSSWVQRVDVIGDFNDWTPERMIRDRSGMWLLVKDLPAGRFKYNYVIDGKKEIKDPWNKNIDPDSRAHGSSVVVVK